MIANFHSHTFRCNHAFGSEEAYVEAALQKNIKLLGFSDHTPYFFPGEYYSTFRMRPEELKGYCDTVLALRKKYAGKIEIPLGLELEYYPDLLPALLPFLRDHGIEYLLLGQHLIGNEIGEHYSGHPTADGGLLRRYCHQSMEAMNTGLFTYFAHPDLFFFTGSEGVYRELMRELCREARGCGLPLEMNLLGIREGRNYPNPVFWEIAAEEGCQVILGCDAHAPEHLLEEKAEPAAREILARFGLTPMDTVALRRI